MSISRNAIILLCSFAQWYSAYPGLAQDAISVTKVDQGLFVHLGAHDGEAEISAAQTDAFLVHALAKTNASLITCRSAIMAANIYGLASVERVETWALLPYGENMVNLLVADLDALGPEGLTTDEIDRVLVPQGAAYIKKNGTWTVRRKPRTAGMGSWTHFFANAQGTNVGDDKLIKPPTSVKWIAGSQYPRKRMSYESQTGIRASDGRVMYEYTQAQGVSKRVLVGRDGFNGLLLWQKAPNFETYISVATQYVMTNDKVIYFPDTGYAAAISCKTGELVRRYTNGVTLSQKNVKTHCGMNLSRPQEQIVSDGKLIQISFNQIVVLDVNTGAKVAEYTEPHGLNLGRPVVSEEEGSIFCVAAEMIMNGHRWPLADVDAVVCIDLKNGTEKWRNTDLGESFRYIWYSKNVATPETTITRHRIGQLAYSKGTLAMLGPEPLNDCANPRLSNWGAFDSKTGRLLWNRTATTPHPYTMIVRNDTLYSCANDLTPFDLRTGAIFDSSIDDRTKRYAPKPKFSVGYNGRCARPSATDNYIMTGLVTFVDRSYGWCYIGVSRSGCARNVVPAHGMMYYTPDACICNGKALSGYEALRFEKAWTAVDDDRRLAGAGILPEKVSLSQTFSSKSIIAVDWDTLMQNANYYSDTYFKWASGSGPVGLARSPYPLTKTIDGKTYSVFLNEHRLECRENGQLKWSFIAGGRISAPPVVFENRLALFGSHDGYVYAVNISTGAPEWRFMAAPSMKKMIAYGQVESAWPIFGVSLSGTMLMFSAGRHPQVDGGIFAYGISAANGIVQWKKQVVTPVYAYPAGTKTSYNRNPYLNADSVEEIGIDPSAPQDIVMNSTNATGGILLTDFGVSVDRPYAGPQSDSAGKNATEIRINGYKARSLVVCVNSDGFHRFSVMSVNGRRIYNTTSESGAIYQLTSQLLSAGKYVIAVKDRTGLIRSMPVSVVYER